MPKNIITKKRALSTLKGQGEKLMNHSTPKVKKPIYKRIWFWILIVVVVIGINGAMNGNLDDKNSSSTSTSSEQKTTKSKTTNSSSEIKQPTKASSQTPAATPITFKQMVADYMANGAAADAKYEGKLLEFQGAVTKVTSGYFGKNDVEIDAGNYTDNPYMNTKAVVKVPGDIAKTLVAGQTYTFVAKGSNAMILDSYVSHINFTDGKIK